MQLVMNFAVLAALLCVLSSASATAPTVLSSSAVTTLQQTTTPAPNASKTMVGASAPGGARYRCDAVSRQCVTVSGHTSSGITYTETECCECASIYIEILSFILALTTHVFLSTHVIYIRDPMCTAPSSHELLRRFHIPSIFIPAIVWILLLKAVLARGLQQWKSCRSVLA